MGHIQKTVSFDEYVWEVCLSSIKTDNFSSYINKLVLIANDAIQDGLIDKSKKITTLYNEIEELKRVVKQLKFDLNKAKNKKTFSFDEVVSRYSLTKEDLDLFRERKDKMDKYNKSNSVVLLGEQKIEIGAVSHQASNAINAEKGISMKPEEARVILENIEQQKLDGVE